MKTRNLTEIAMMTAVIAVLAPISIPLVGEVPISLATFAVELAGLVLGYKEGAICAALYLVLGAVGVPVFAAYASGLSILVGVTGGYLVGYVFLAGIAGFVYERFGRDLDGAMKYGVMALGMLLGNFVLYVLGTIWFIHMTGMTLAASMAACVIPFIPGDIVKMVVAALITPRLEKVVSRNR